MQKGKLYMDPKGFIYECLDRRDDDHEVLLVCWNPNDPKMYGQMIYQYLDSPSVQGLTEVDSDYLDMEIRHSATSIRYHMREAQQRRDACARFQKELRDRGNR